MLRISFIRIRPASVFVFLVLILGMFVYGRSSPLPPDIAILRDWAEQGDAQSQLELGQLYQEGEGVDRDFSEAAAWYHKAADEGMANAQKRLGYLYATGDGVEHDNAKAVQWYRPAAEQGHAFAMNKLGAMYEEGRGVPQDSEKADYWFQKATKREGE